MRPGWSPRLSLEKAPFHHSPVWMWAPSSFLSSLLMLPAGCVLPQKGFQELDFGFLFGLQHSVLVFCYTPAFRSWETTKLSLCRTWSTSPVPFAPCWGSRRNSPCPLAMQLASKRKCSPESLLRSQCSALGRIRSYIGGWSIDKPTFM